MSAVMKSSMIIRMSNLRGKGAARTMISKESSR